MPTYIFKNKKTGIVYEDFMSITDMEKILSNPHMELVIDSVNIISQTGDNIDAKTDSGWKEHLPKYQKHIQIVNLLNNMVDEEPTKMLKLIKSERNTEIKLCEKLKELTNLNSIKDINISIITKTKTNGRL